MVSSRPIKVKVFAVLANDGGTHHLVWRGADSVKNSEFHRLLGGHLEFGESTLDGVLREVAEETGTTLEEPRLLGVLENRFVHEDVPGHEIVFVYTGRLADRDVVGPEGGWLSDNDQPIWVEWRPLADDGIEIPLYPPGVGELISAS